MKDRKSVMPEKTQTIYAGRFDDLYDWAMWADDVRVFKGDRITFQFSGEDDGGPFRCEGTARLSPSGFYVASDVPIQCTRGGRAVICFSNVRCDLENCKFNVMWSQDGCEGSPWRFEADLDATSVS